MERTNHALFIPPAIRMAAGLNALRTGANGTWSEELFLKNLNLNFFKRNTQVGSKGPGSVKIPGEAGRFEGRFYKKCTNCTKSGPKSTYIRPNYL